MRTLDGDEPMPDAAPDAGVTTVEPVRDDLGRFTRGRSGNPTGRSRSAAALSRAIRDGIEPSELARMAIEKLRSEQLAPREWILLWCAVSDRGWSKPAAQLEHKVQAVVAQLPPEWSRWSPVQRAQYLDAHITAQPALDVGGDDEGDEL